MYAGTVPLAEFPWLLEDSQVTRSSESGAACPVEVGSEPARARIDDDTLSCIPWKI